MNEYLKDEAKGLLESFGVISSELALSQIFFGI